MCVRCAGSTGEEGQGGAVFRDADGDVGERGQHAADAHAPHRPEAAAPAGSSSPWRRLE
jgi:hypothetical protein